MKLIKGKSGAAVTVYARGDRHSLEWVIDKSSATIFTDELAQVIMDEVENASEQTVFYLELVSP